MIDILACLAVLIFSCVGGVLAGNAIRKRREGNEAVRAERHAEWVARRNQRAEYKRYMDGPHWQWHRLPGESMEDLEKRKLRDATHRDHMIVTHHIADANPSAHTTDESEDCEACTQAPGWFPGKYADLPMVERNRKAFQLEHEWMAKHPRFSKGESK